MFALIWMRWGEDWLAILSWKRLCGLTSGRFSVSLLLYITEIQFVSFRRQRFHWPTDSEHDPEGFTAPCIPNTRKMDYKRLIGGCEEPVHIRTIHAYHATKTDMTSFASPLFSSSTVSVSSQWYPITSATVSILCEVARIHRHWWPIGHVQYWVMSLCL